jgi:hypothetical protein
VSSTAPSKYLDAGAGERYQPGSREIVGRPTVLVEQPPASHISGATARTGPLE